MKCWMFLACMLLALTGCRQSEKTDETLSVTDRDGNTYGAVRIGSQVWMSSNLNLRTHDSWCKDDDPENCKRNGRLYTWDDAVCACPDGWSLPNNLDWKKLKLHAEAKGKESLKFLDESGLYWSATDDDEVDAVNAYWVLHDVSGKLVHGLSLKDNALSVRCIRKPGVKHGAQQKPDTTKFGGRRARDTSGKKSGYIEGFGGIGSGLPDYLVKDSTGGVHRSPDDIMKVVRWRTPGLRHIYNKYLKKNPGLEGKVTLKFTISPEGEVVAISVESSTTGNEEFDTQIKEAVSRWPFNKVSSLKNTTVTIPFTFSEK